MDAIFVFAGHPARKRHGLALWKQGKAPVLVLSVARFEWRRFAELELWDDGGLVSLVEATPPQERHFFVAVRGETVETYRVSARGWGTWREAEALADFLRRENARSVLIVSSASHLRRAVMTVRAMAGPGIRVEGEPTPWLRSRRRAVLREALKLVLYRARLAWTSLSGR